MKNTTMVPMKRRSLIVLPPSPDSEGGHFTKSYIFGGKADE
jgi:hypothetical protein